MSAKVIAAPSPPPRGRAWRDGDRCPEMIDLPLGSFEMGERQDDKFATAVERPRHWVEIAHAVALACFPVTVEEFAEFSGERVAQAAARLPVASVSWEGAAAYCQWLSHVTGHPYRLPSEAEWEYACCAGQTTAFPNGDTLSIADANFCYDEHGQKIGPGRRTPAGAYPPNAFGLHDMIGNVCEWVAEAWHPGYLAAPVDGSAWNSGAEIGLRVLRGGAWDYLPRLLRSTWRDCLHPQTRRDNVGFRVACAMRAAA